MYALFKDGKIIEPTKTKTKEELEHFLKLFGFKGYTIEEVKE